MAKQKKSLVKTRTKTPKNTSFFMGLSRSQTQRAGIGVIFLGIVLFMLAGYSYTNKATTTQSILPDGAATTAIPTEVSTIIGKTDTSDTLTTPGAGSFGSASQTASEAGMISPTPSTIQPTASVTPTSIATRTVTPTIMPIPTKEATSSVQKENMQIAITRLPNTSSKVTYTVLKNDSLAKIGKQLCGSERAWLSLIKTNSLLYPYTIQPGQTLLVTCN